MLPSDQADEVRIGNRVGGTVRTFDGFIDDVFIFGRPLLPDEIASLHQASPGGPSLCD